MGIGGVIGEPTITGGETPAVFFDTFSCVFHCLVLSGYRFSGDGRKDAH